MTKTEQTKKLTFDFDKQTIMKEITLNIVERITVLNTFDTFKGSIVTYKAILDDVKDLALTDEEKAEINFQTVAEEKDGQTFTSFKWEKSIDKSVKLSSESVKFLVDTIKKKDEAGEITLKDGAFVTLLEKLG